VKREEGRGGRDRRMKERGEGKILEKGERGEGNGTGSQIVK